MQNYSRPLDTNKVVEDFLKLSLLFDYTKEPKLKGIIPRIVDGELGVSKFNTYNQTLLIRDMRDAAYRDDNVRWELRKQIIDELYTKRRLAKDDQIELKKGGALPKSILKSDRRRHNFIGHNHSNLQRYFF